MGNDLINAAITLAILSAVFVPAGAVLWLIVSRIPEETLTRWRTGSDRANDRYAPQRSIKVDKGVYRRAK